MRLTNSFCVCRQQTEIRNRCLTKCRQGLEHVARLKSTKTALYCAERHVRAREDDVVQEQPAEPAEPAQDPLAGLHQSVAQMQEMLRHLVEFHSSEKTTVIARGLSRVRSPAQLEADLQVPRGAFRQPRAGPALTNPFYSNAMQVLISVHLDVL